MATSLTSTRLTPSTVIMAVVSLFAVLGLAGIGVPAAATVLTNDRDLAWASHRDLTGAELSERIAHYRNRGLMPIDVDGYPDGYGFRYSMVWRENTDRRRWAEHRDMSSAQYASRWSYYRSRGYRPLDIAVYGYASHVLYAGIWVENTENIPWASYRDLSSTRYAEIYAEKVAAGYRLVDMEAYQTDAGLRYSAIWYKNVDQRGWIQRRDMSRSTYQQEVSQRGANGQRLVDFESYTTPQGQRYAGIWEQSSGFAWQVRTDLDELEFANLWRESRDKGYRLIDFERYATAGGPRYGGVWLENDARLRYAGSAALDRQIMDYRERNNLPGISVAIIRDGTMLYQRGFGFADERRGKVAHSGSVYGAASVSKAIGGVLAARLVEQQQLRDGTSFSLNLGDPIRDHIDGLPPQHVQSVRQIFSHRGCVPHYKTDPGIDDQTTHYATATAALRSIQETRLIEGCELDEWNYSTPTFTFGGAVLEQATGRSISELLDRELFRPLGLDSMRVQFATEALPANYDRAVPYVPTPWGNFPIRYRNNSWKVLGGGIETNVADMARFAWMLLDGQILSPDYLNNVLLRKGLGWNRKRDCAFAQRRVAEKDGSVDGARSFLRMYRDDGLVIAILSNSRVHAEMDVAALTDELAGIVFEDDSCRAVFDRGYLDYELPEQLLDTK